MGNSPCHSSHDRLHEVRVLGQIGDQVAAVAQLADLAIDLADRRIGRGDPLESAFGGNVASASSLARCGRWALLYSPRARRWVSESVFRTLRPDFNLGRRFGRGLRDFRAPMWKYRNVSVAGTSAGSNSTRGNGRLPGVRALASCSSAWPHRGSPAPMRVVRRDPPGQPWPCLAPYPAARASPWPGCCTLFVPREIPADPCHGRNAAFWTDTCAPACSASPCRCARAASSPWPPSYDARVRDAGRHRGLHGRHTRRPASTRSPASFALLHPVLVVASAPSRRWSPRSLTGAGD